MKTVSIKQPYAELILQGRNTIHLRSWKTKHRGPIAVHASQEIKQGACHAYGLNPDALPLGALVGIVDIVDVFEFDEAIFEEMRDQHLSLKKWNGKDVGWQVANPVRLSEPIPMVGRQGIYEVPDELILIPDQTLEVAGIASTTNLRHIKKNGTVHQALPDPARPFALHVEPEGERTYGLSLYQWPVKAIGVEPQPQRVAQITGSPLLAIADHILETIRRAGYKLTDLSPRRREPFWLAEEDGVRLGLLFLAIAPLSKMDRVETISREIRAMPTEEAYYWYSKCTTPRWAARAQRAFRILLSTE